MQDHEEKKKHDILRHLTVQWGFFLYTSLKRSKGIEED